MATAAMSHEIDLLEGDIDARISALGLEQNVADISTKGYTIVRNAAPLEFFDRLRSRIIELVDEQRSAGSRTAVGTHDTLNARHGSAEGREAGEVFDESAWLLLGRGRVFEEAVCNPYFVTLTEAFLGKGFQIQVCGGTVKGQGSSALPMHTDSSNQAEPFPPHAFGLTSLWACDDWTEEGGSTVIVPHSWKKGRSPLPGEAEDMGIPLECPRGSILFWNAATWHGSLPRKIPGLRVGFHTPCTHLSYRTLESYDHLPDEIVNRNPPVLGRMIGREDSYGKQTETTIPFEQMARMATWRKGPRY